MKPGQIIYLSGDAPHSKWMHYSVISDLWTSDTGFVCNTLYFLKGEEEPTEIPLYPREFNVKLEII